jgi:hypothetical protein
MERFPWGSATDFKMLILSGYKIHTAQIGGRWSVGRKIHFSTGNRTPEYNCFMEGIVFRVDRVLMQPEGRKIYINDSILSNYQKSAFIINDGFRSSEDFWKWFNQPFIGQLVQWTDLIYTKYK